jgi:hypothetical protein
VNGQFVGNTPVRVTLEDVITVLMGGFLPNSKVKLVLYSDRIPLGTFTADSDGFIRTELSLPPTLNPGVHLIEASGSTPSEAALTQQVRIELPGRPVGSYTTYLPGFRPEVTDPTADTPVEHVTVTLDGEYLTKMIPDEDGGLLVVIPNVDRLRSPKHFLLVATSDLTGKVISKEIQSIPTAASLWATSKDVNAVNISGTGFTAQGRVHSEGGILIGGNKASLLGGSEYATKLADSGTATKISPAAVQVAAGQGRPPIPDISEYRPDGAMAKEAGYRAISASACINGVWSPQSSDDLAPVTYVPCSVALSAKSSVYEAQIVAEGNVTISGNSVSLGSNEGGKFSILTAAKGSKAVVINGQSANIKGSVFAPSGDAEISGGGTSLTCGVVASHVTVSGSSISTPMTGRCLN